MLKEKVGKSNLEEWSKGILKNMRRLFRIWTIGCLGEKGLYLQNMSELRCAFTSVCQRIMV